MSLMSKIFKSEIIKEEDLIVKYTNLNQFFKIKNIEQLEDYIVEEYIPHGTIPRIDVISELFYGDKKWWFLIPILNENIKSFIFDLPVEDNYINKKAYNKAEEDRINRGLSEIDYNIFMDFYNKYQEEYEIKRKIKIFRNIDLNVILNKYINRLD